MFIDSHSHLHFPVYKDDIENVLFRMKEKNVLTLTVGTSYQNSLEAIEFSKKYKIPCSVGFHPSHARPAGVVGYLDPTEEVYDEEFNTEKLEMLLEDGNNRVVIKAIGECGLDYFRLPDNESLKKQFKEKQREAFEAQIQLAKEFNLPLIIHTRASKEDPTDAYHDTYAVIKSLSHKVTGVMHCFLADKDIAKQFLDLGFYLSFSGIVTFKRADTVRESAIFCPADQILSETDCPYLAPEPFRGKQNEPSYVEFVVRKLEELKKVSLVEDIAQNFERLFWANY